MTTETPEEAAFTQQQIEHFARLARNVQITVEALANEFDYLDDYPGSVGEAMPQLRALADSMARTAIDWAKINNADFKSSPWG
jgi:hypothetical protein